jgi:phosphomannomutase
LGDTGGESILCTALFLFALTLIKSISGIRGTIGGKPGEGLTPIDIAKYALAYGTYVRNNGGKKIVLGRDARISGDMVHNIVAGNLLGIGIDIIDLDLSTTPTVEVAVKLEQADGGIIITASHNPRQWNALKLLNSEGEFISEAVGKEVLDIAEAGNFEFVEADKLGVRIYIDDYIQKHIDLILEHPLVDVEAIKAKKYKIVVDAVNSTGGIAVPQLLYALGVDKVIELYCEPNGRFPHNPEPLPEHLAALSAEVNHYNAHLGIAVDPDVDRLAFVDDKGMPFGEEYTLVAVADYILSHKKGATVSNLSSSNALKYITQKHGCEYFASAVGEVNVVEMMKQTNAVIGGEGNGGVIVPELHYGRDALIGIALFLSHMAHSGKPSSVFRSTYPNYYISKNKIELDSVANLDEVLQQVSDKYKKHPQNKVDGLKIEFDNDWVHLRRSNTEPIIRIYAESNTEKTADSIALKLKADIIQILKEQS